jgi:Tfp pilus assembly protein PilN
MRAVNLLPLDAQQHKSIRQEDPAVVIGSALGVIVMIALAASFMTAHNRANTQQKRLEAARLELAQLSEKRKPTPKPSAPQVPITPIVPPPAITGQEASWLGAVSSQLSKRIAWDRVLREVSLVIPADVTLTTLTMTAPSGAAGAAPTQGFVIDGSTYSYDSVARLLSRLALVPDLEDVTLTSTTAADATSVQFNITAAIKGAVVAAPAPVVPPPTDTTTTAASS